MRASSCWSRMGIPAGGVSSAEFMAAAMRALSLAVSEELLSALFTTLSLEVSGVVSFFAGRSTLARKTGCFDVALISGLS